MLSRCLLSSPLLFGARALSTSTSLYAERDITHWHEFGKKIVAIGRNYSEHAKELGNDVPTSPFFFLKPTTSYVPMCNKNGVTVEVPPNCTSIHHEVELGVVIGKDGRDIDEENAFDHVAGYCVALDMTAREIQTKAKNAGLPWSEAKGYDTFCPIGGFVQKSAIPDPHSIHLRMTVNGEIKQEGCSDLMIFNIPALIAHISRVMKLEVGDLILTGTPSGVGPVVEGDEIIAELLPAHSGHSTENPHPPPPSLHPLSTITGKVVNRHHVDLIEEE
eukprot:CAMPEP_0201508408 /NCGR_PEP_ID=MMETSP0161_2-20130828/1786_1 /ASSEMBLY_ACC=CAM_ASM_000251 /TAXON_ID=180227 /ORGANISM="Neoparamoeba aestuarina, Strain SoJaBio B1-5/56/2" /LENGTH=274 /DNA_ID=CAMNT_0047903061 /DNA_START=380 /DNA_END=1204 /DNA_ORIENTATION=-